MSRLLLYNPENDIALASGLAHFTPPAVGRQMALAGALLPFWWAEEDDEVMIPRSLFPAALALKRQHGLMGTPGYHQAREAEPWGWSLHTLTMMKASGIDPAILPSEQQIERIRALSHRRTTIDIHRRLGTPAELIPVEASGIEEALEVCRRFGSAVVKQPWSCSGRGVFFTRDLSEEELLRRLGAAINRQGSLLIEPEYERTREMAALFYASNGRVEYRGMSLFSADAAGFYTGNIVMPAGRLEDMCGAEALAAAETLEPILTDIIGRDYTGWLGVDMLLHKSGLNACMELNLRMTMGVVAHLLARRGLTGTLTTARTPLPSDLLNLSPTSAPAAIVLRKDRRQEI